MGVDPNSNLEELFPLPKGMKLRTPKFGTNPYAPFVPVPTDADRGGTRPPFTISWEDREQGLTAQVREAENGRLEATVSSADPGMLGKAWLSVGLVGTGEWQMIRKSIPLDVATEQGCAGAADFGPLANAVNELGTHIGLVVFLLLLKAPNGGTEQRINT